MWSSCLCNPYPAPPYKLLLPKSPMTSVLPNPVETLIAFSFHHSLLLVDVSSCFPDSLGSAASFSQEQFPERDAAVSHYQPTPKPAGGRRDSGLKKVAGRCPPHASNPAGPKPNSFGPDHSTCKMFPDCHCLLKFSHLLTRLMSASLLLGLLGLRQFILHTVTS